jgi:tRNA(Ile)-lysidine synthase
MVTTALHNIDLSTNELLIGVSGGLDSTVLVHACVAIGLQPNLLHINYQLRGDESEADEAFVRQLAEKYQLDLNVIRCPKNTTVGAGINLQQAARDFRRTFFLDWINQSPKHKVLLAHHADDQVETFFLQFARNAGMKGLGGMHVDQAGFVRPFLALSKQQLHDYALSEGLSWREDASNQSLKYNRNKWRNVFIPLMEKENPAINESVLLLQGVFRENFQALQANFLVNNQALLDQKQVSFLQWNALSDDEKYVFCNALKWPSWTVARLNELVNLQKSTSFLVGNTTVYKTKTGVAWTKNEEEILTKTLVISKVDSLPEYFDKATVYLDEAKVVGQLVLRKVRETDRIAPIGMKGTQLVTKVLKDAGYSLQERAQFQVVVDDERVIWIPGIKVNRTSIADKMSQQLLKISVQ